MMKYISKIGRSIKLLFGWILTILWKKGLIAVIINLPKKKMQIWSKVKADALIMQPVRSHLQPSSVFLVCRKTFMEK